MKIKNCYIYIENEYGKFKKEFERRTYHIYRKIK